MQEQLITFETAKLAKERGFILSHPLYLYEENGEILDLKRSFDLARQTFLLDSTTILAPTQSLLQKWLREIHNIEVSANVNFYNKKVKLGYYYTIDKFDENNIHDGKNYDDDQISIIGNEEGNNTFEEALEVGLQESLKLIEITKQKQHE